MIGQIARFLSDGGVGMVPILLLALACNLVAVVQLIVIRKLNLTPVIVGCYALMWLIALALLFGGLSDAGAYGATAPPDMKAALMAESLVLGLNPAALAGILGVPTALFATVALTIATLVRTREVTDG